MAEYSANQVTITNGFKAVVINSGESPENVRQGDFLFVTGSDPVAINRTYINDNDQHVIELTKNWGQGNKNNQPAIVIPSTAEYKAVADALKNANLLVNDNFVAMQDWQTKTGTVTFTNIDGTTTTVKTLKQIESEAQAQLDTYHPYPYAMRKGEFEAIRKSNRLKYAASGFIHFGLHSDDENSINEGLQVYSTLTAPSQKHNFLAGRSRDESSFAESLTEAPILNILGVEVEFNLNASADYHKTLIRLPQQEDGTRTYDSATGTSVTHATPAIAFASETETNKVVINRYDMWGFEVFLREVSEADPWVYKFGCIQNRSPNIEGVDSQDVLSKPASYFAWHLGDTSTIGRGVNWFEATDSEKAQIAANPKHNIYFDDSTGKFYQWCARGRSLAGAGNGQWGSIKSNMSTPLRFGIDQRVKPQGSQETIPAPLGRYDDPVVGWFVGVNSNENRFTAKNDIYDLGVFSSVRTNSSGTGLSSESNERDYYAINSECHFLVCGTVERLNSGSYHPSYNNKGTRPWRYNPNIYSVIGKWYQGVDLNVNSSLMCFELLTQSDEKLGASAYGGGIETGPANSGRPDGRFYDGVYASGAGGVSRDMRYSAWDISDWQEKSLKIKKGDYRGREKDLFTKVVKITPENAQDGKLLWTGSDNTALSANMGWISLGTSKDNLSLEIGSKIHAFDSSTGKYWSGRIANFQATSSSTICRVMFYNWTPGEIPLASDTTYVVFSQNLGLEVSGKYSHLDVIGDPENILACQDIRDGWYGGYIPSNPDGSEKKYIFNKPFFNNTLTTIHTDNLGTNWVVASEADGVNFTENSKRATWPVGRVILCYYLTSANYTYESNNEAVSGGISGIGSVYISSRGNTNTSGRLLGVSLIDKVLNSSVNVREEHINLKKYGLRTDTGELSSDYPTTPPSHDEINIDGFDEIVAYKCLDYITQDSGMAYINYAFSELVYDSLSESWGDDFKFSIIDGTQFGTDDNNKQKLFGTHRLVEPLGWIKNDK